ncbi:MAG TPA: SMP-30/gluconolactonase/LRE family protein [Anaerolineales bacterium]|nr:SMP-30/gluconolactonase/LRE family protein [Anaerolineales bacterium]
MNAELVLDAKAMLGEGPAWDAKTQTLYWLDILGMRVYAGTRTLAQLEELVGCLAPCKNGHLILGTRFDLVDLEPDSGQLQTLACLDSEAPTNRINDGKCDPAGNFLVGTMDMNEKDPVGTLYSFNGKAVTAFFGGVTISNGLAWSTDHKTLYYIDTPSREVKAFDYDTATGKASNMRIVIRVEEALGWPDGMTSDMAGNLWIAMWGGAQVTKWNPNTGELLEQIAVPALHTSSCVFGGRDMNELYITSARTGLSNRDLIKYPLSGGLFKVMTNTTGMKTFEFG